jgi:hypothetical protein
VNGKKAFASTDNRTHGQMLRIISQNETLSRILLWYALLSYLNETPYTLLDEIEENLIMPSTLA